MQEKPFCLAVMPYIAPYDKAQTACCDEYRDSYHNKGVCGVIAQSHCSLSCGEQVKACVAESGNGQEYRFENSECAEVGNKDKRKYDSADKFDGKRVKDNFIEKSFRCGFEGVVGKVACGNLYG